MAIASKCKLHVYNSSPGPSAIKGLWGGGGAPFGDVSGGQLCRQFFSVVGLGSIKEDTFTIHNEEETTARQYIVLVCGVWCSDPNVGLRLVLPEKNRCMSILSKAWVSAFWGGRGQHCLALPLVQCYCSVSPPLRPLAYSLSLYGTHTLLRGRNVWEGCHCKECTRARCMVLRSQDRMWPWSHSRSIVPCKPPSAIDSAVAPSWRLYAGPCRSNPSTYCQIMTVLICLLLANLQASRQALVIRLVSHCHTKTALVLKWS